MRNESFDPRGITHHDNFVLQKIKEVLELELSPYEFEQLTDFDVQRKYRNLAIQIRRFFFGERITTQVPVEFAYTRPKTAWQHVKRDYFPRFWLKIFPVQMETITETKVINFERNFFYPNLYIKGVKGCDVFVVRDMSNNFSISLKS